MEKLSQEKTNEAFGSLMQIIKEKFPDKDDSYHKTMAGNLMSKKKSELRKLGLERFWQPPVVVRQRWNGKKWVNE